MLIQKVYEVDPLECDRPGVGNVLGAREGAGSTPECGREMRIISFIQDPAVIYKILNHLDLLDSSGHDPLRSPPGSELPYEPTDWTKEVLRTTGVSQERLFYDDLPYGDEITFPG